MPDSDTNTEESTADIPRRAYVLGTDAKDRDHHHLPGTPHEVWVVVDGAVEHHELVEGHILNWIEFVDEQVGWSERKQVEKPPFAGLVDTIEQVAGEEAL